MIPRNSARSDPAKLEEMGSSSSTVVDWQWEGKEDACIWRTEERPRASERLQIRKGLQRRGVVHRELSDEIRTWSWTRMFVS
jgi:hypothetical protein